MMSEQLIFFAVLSVLSFLLFLKPFYAVSVLYG